MLKQTSKNTIAMNKKLYTTIILSIIVLFSPFWISRLNAQDCLWAKRAGGSGSDNSQSVSTDASGNVYVTGSFTSATITFGSTTLTNSDNSGNSSDIFIAKYDASGNVLWAKSAGGTSSEFGNSVSPDANGNVYATGRFSSPTISFGSTTLTNAVSAKTYIVKYDVSGNVLWAKSVSVGGTSYEFDSSVSADTSGNVYLTGKFSNSTITFDSITLTNAGFNDIFIAKYDAAGNVLWVKSAGGNYEDWASSVSSDASGNAYVTGFFGSSTITFGSTTLTNAGGSDIFIAKYDSNGNVLWAKSAIGSGSNGGNSVATDFSGNIYITGYFSSPIITFGSITLSSIMYNNNDIFITKYDANGNVLWAKSVGSNGYEYGNCVSIDNSGNVYITGKFAYSTITFGSTTLSSEGSSYDIFIAKYDANGNVLWAKSVGGINTNDIGNSVATDASGNVYMTGYYSCPTINFGSNSLTNAGITGSSDMFIAKYSNPTPCSAFYTLFPDSVLQSYWYLVNQCMGSDSLSADSLDYVWAWGDSANSTSIGAYPSFTYNTAGNYTICVTITDSSTGCTNTYCDSTYITKSLANQMISVNVIPANSPLITGISPTSQTVKWDLGINPNPTSSTINLTIPKLIKTNIIITNLTGKQVATYNLQNTTTKTIDVSHLAEGVYFVTLKSDEGVVTKKMVKTN